MAKNKKLLKRVCIILLIATIIGVMIFLFKGKNETNVANRINTKEITLGDINVKISGSGVIEPLERYAITPLVYGTIEECNFNETDLVKKDDVLYKFESFTVENSIKKMQNNIDKLIINQNKLKENLERTDVYATHSGRISGFVVKENENVATASVGKIIDDSYFVAEVFFNKAQIDEMYVGQDAIVVIPELMEDNISGRISKISSDFIPDKKGISLYSVEITVDKKMSVPEGTLAYGIVDDIESVGGNIKEFEKYSIVPEISGKVKEVYVSNNDYVKKGQKLFKIDEDTYKRSITEGEIDLKSAYLSLEETKKNLEDYSIKSPIDGVVLSKEYKKDDSIDSNSRGTTLMVVANMSKVKFDMEIDELDIAKVKKGQDVEITAEALEGKIFTGKVTSVAEEGTSTNGVTNYIVQVTIDEPGELKSGMNVDAIIIIEDKNNILVVPSLAINKEGTKYYVDVYLEDSEKTEKRYIEIGVSDNSNVEVLSGLKKGEKVVVNSSGSLFDFTNISNMKNDAKEQRQNMISGMSGGGMYNRGGSR